MAVLNQKICDVSNNNSFELFAQNLKKNNLWKEIYILCLVTALPIE